MDAELSLTPANATAGVLRSSCSQHTPCVHTAVNAIEYKVLPTVYCSQALCRWLASNSSCQRWQADALLTSLMPTSSPVCRFVPKNISPKLPPPSLRPKRYFPAIRISRAMTRAGHFALSHYSYMQQSTFAKTPARRLASAGADVCLISCGTIRHRALAGVNDKQMSTGLPPHTFAHTPPGSAQDRYVRRSNSAFASCMRLALSLNARSEIFGILNCGLRSSAGRISTHSA